MTMEKSYVAIDLKSFYASVECVERGLDPLNTNLVVADERRSEKTICLAVSPSLKKYGIPGRARLFEVIQKVKEINRQRERRSPLGYLSGESCFDDELQNDCMGHRTVYHCGHPRLSSCTQQLCAVFGAERISGADRGKRQACGAAP